MDKKKHNEIENKKKKIVEIEEFNAIDMFTNFLNQRAYGEFKATVTTNRQTHERVVMIQITDNYKVNLKRTNNNVIKKTEL